MAVSPMVGTRVPIEWQRKIQLIAQASGLREADVVREAIARYLEEVNPDGVKGAIADLQARVTRLEEMSNCA